MKLSLVEAEQRVKALPGINYKRVTLTYSTHSEGGLTEMTKFMGHRYAT